MRRIHLMLAPLLLTSCGSDDDGTRATAEVAAAPTPTPSPTPSPTPAPSPSPTPTPSSSGYTPYAQLSGKVTLSAGQTGAYTSPPSLLYYRPFGTEQAALDYDASARAYTTRVAGSTDTFVASELDASAPSGTQRYVKSSGLSLAVTQPSAGGRGFDYLRFARVERPSSAGTPYVAAILTGIATKSADIPASGSATFARTVVMGDAYVTTANGTTTAYTLSRSTVTMSINYSTGTATGRFTIIGTPVGGGADVTLSTIDIVTDFGGNGTITAVSGDYTPQSPTTAEGVLFGPGGSEAGLLLYLQGASAAGSTLRVVLMGAGGN